MSKIKRCLGALKVLGQNYFSAWREGELRPLFLCHLRELVEGMEKPKPHLAGLIGPRDFNALTDIRKGALKEHGKLSPLSFSILMPVYQPKPGFLRTAILSVLYQTAPDFELLIGFDGPQPKEVLQVLREIEDPRIRVFSYERGGISSTTNALATEAKGDYLLLVDHDDWIAPDLLLQYHKKLLKHVGEKIFLYCDEFKIDIHDRPIPHSLYQKEATPPFPFVFFNQVTHALLLSKTLWNEASGLRKETDGAQDFDLVLRLDLLGAKGVNVPYPLYAWRVHPQSTTFGAKQKPLAHGRGLQALQEYAEQKKLSWDYADGKVPLSYKATPFEVEDRELLVFGDIDSKTYEEMSLFALQKEIGFVTCTPSPFFFDVQRTVKTPSYPLVIRKELLSPSEIEALHYPHRHPHLAIAARLSSIGLHHLYLPQTKKQT